MRAFTKNEEGSGGAVAPFTLNQEVWAMKRKGERNFLASLGTVAKVASDAKIPVAWDGSRAQQPFRTNGVDVYSDGGAGPCQDCQDLGGVWALGASPLFYWLGRPQASRAFYKRRNMMQPRLPAMAVVAEMVAGWLAVDFLWPNTSGQAHGRGGVTEALKVLDPLNLSCLLADTKKRMPLLTETRPHQCRQSLWYVCVLMCVLLLHCAVPTGLSECRHSCAYIHVHYLVYRLGG